MCSTKHCKNIYILKALHQNIWLTDNIYFSPNLKRITIFVPQNTVNIYIYFFKDYTKIFGYQSVYSYPILVGGPKSLVLAAAGWNKSRLCLVPHWAYNQPVKRWWKQGQDNISIIIVAFSG